MAEDINVQGVTNVLSEKDSVARVAFDMMKFMRQGTNSEQGNFPENFFRLYRKCYLAASGQPLAKVLKGD